VNCADGALWEVIVVVDAVRAALVSIKERLVITYVDKCLQKLSAELLCLMRPRLCVFPVYDNSYLLALIGMRTFN
jgi:hypothetical protein